MGSFDARARGGLTLATGRGPSPNFGFERLPAGLTFEGRRTSSEGLLARIGAKMGSAVATTDAPLRSWLPLTCTNEPSTGVEIRRVGCDTSALERRRPRLRLLRLIVATTVD